MVTTEEQKQQLATTEEELAKQREKISQYEKEAILISQKQIPQRRFGSGVTKEVQQGYLQRREKAVGYIESLKPIKEQIGQTQTQVDTAQSQIARYEQQKLAYERAERYAEQGSQGNTGAIRAAYINLKEKGYDEAYQYYLDLYNYYKGKQENKPVGLTPPGTYGVSTPEGVRLIPEPGTIGFSTPEGYVSYRVEKPVIDKPKVYAPGTSFTYGQGVVSMPPKPEGILEGIRTDLGRVRETTKSGFISFGTGLAVSGVGTVQFVKTVFTKPLDIPKGLYKVGKKVVTGEGFPEIGRIIKEESAFATGFVAGEIITAKGISAGTKITSAKTSEIFTKLSPIYKPVEAGKIKLISSTGKEITLELKSNIPTQSLAEQIKFAGTTRPIAVSGARDLFGLFNKNIDIQKPLASEELLSVKGKELLKKFDVGDIKPKELAKLDKEIQSLGTKGILERTFFADPKGYLRPSRLGIKKETDEGFLNYFTEDITLRKQRPQAIIFEDVKISSIPKDIEKTIGLLSEGKKVKPEDYGKLLEFQTTPGQFKPVGFITKESEIIARGKLRKTGVAGVTLIDGKRVKIIRAELVSKDIKDILKSSDISDINKLSKETGFSKSELKSYMSYDKKYISPYRLSRPIKYVKPYSPSITSKTPSSIVPSRTSISPPTSTSKSPFSGIASRTSISPPTSTSKTSRATYPGRTYTPSYPGIPKTPTPKNPMLKIGKGKKFGTTQDLTTAYRTFVKQGGKKKYLGGLFEKGTALRIGESVATKTLRATFGVEATRQKIKGRQTQYTPSKIFRGFKIEKGKKIRLEDTYIQKKGTRLGSRSEVSEILSARRRR